MKILVLGYGNRNRADDGVGWYVVEQLQRSGLPAAVEILGAHQLEVDHAETISHYDLVVFVDAAMAESRQLVARTAVKPNFESHAVAHYLAPGDVVGLCSTLYGREPQAVLFSIRGHDFDFGTTLSAKTEKAAQDVIRQIGSVIKMAKRGRRSASKNKPTFA